MSYVRVCEHDAAVYALAAGISTSATGLSAYWLRLDPIWNPLRGNARFQLVAAAAEGTSAVTPAR